ncbi:MAG TPA: MgtC/SapB family protein [Gemmataceae bacterium]|nr:MgtC/SapB family protein [Gemmataceae bacterium]
METIWNELVKEFSDLPDAATATRLSIRLAVAALLGGMLGFNRERVHKEAGLRTHMLVAAGTALFIAVPQLVGLAHADLSRVIQGIVTGLGFLGAGAILKHTQDRKIRGLTTAAGIWFTAAIGVCAGLGQLTSAVVATLVALLILAVVPLVERSIHDKDGAGP